MENKEGDIQLFVVIATNTRGDPVWGLSAEGLSFGMWDSGHSLLDGDDVVRCMELAQLEGFTDVVVRKVSIGDMLTDAELRRLHRNKLISDKQLTDEELKLLVE